MNVHRMAGYVALGLAAWLTAGACGSRATDERFEGEAVALAASAEQWLGSVAAAHDEADAALERGARGEAATTLRQALARSVPAMMAAADVRVVQQDVWYRLAEVELSRAEEGAALSAAEAGLALGHARDVFVANLHIVRGQALEASGRDADAAASYAEALEINSALLAAALRGRDGGAP